MDDASKMYLVTYSLGSYEDYHEHDIFVTKSEEKAQKYIEKFNRILEKWKDYYNKAYREIRVISNKKEERISDRYFQLHDITGAYYEPIEVR